MSFAHRPSARIEIAGQSLSAAEAGLQTLEVALGLGRHGRAELTLWTGSKFAGASAGEACTIELGAEGDETLVLTGEIIARRQERDGIVLEALDKSGKLSRLRQTITFEDSSIDDIVSRIAGEADMSVQSDAGDTLAIYYVTAHRPLWDHLRDLAALGGRDLHTGADGTLLFLEGGAGTDHTLRYGAELLGWTVIAGETPVPTTFAAHGTASQSGTWHWIGTDPLGEDPGQARVIGAFADQSLADTASEASAARSARAALQGQLLVTGDAALRPADTVSVTDLPGGDPDGMRICAVRHRLDGETGFTTTLDIQGGGDGGGLLGLVGGLI